MIIVEIYSVSPITLNYITLDLTVETPAIITLDHVTLDRVTLDRRLHHVQPIIVLT